MLLKHAGESEEFNLISVTDLAFDILWMAESASYIIPKPGRIQLHSDDLKPLIKFTDQTGIALTEKSVRKLFNCLYDSIKSNFRIHPYQTKNKNSYGYEDIVIDSIISYPKLRQIGAEITVDNIKSLIKEYTYASILYREYRCKAVHEAAGIYVDSRKFWKLRRPYFIEISSYFSPYPVFKLEFPSLFLIECLETCVKCAEKAVIGKGLLPPPIWNAICDFKEIEFMDMEGMEEARPIKLKIE
jgi:hypothetical protein